MELHARHRKLSIESTNCANVRVSRFGSMRGPRRAASRRRSGYPNPPPGIMSLSCIVPLLQSAFEVESTRDHSDVGERLREVSEEDTRLRVDLLRKQAEMIRPGPERVVEFHRLVEPTDVGEIVDEPERAGQDRTLRSGSVRRLASSPPSSPICSVSDPSSSLQASSRIAFRIVSASAAHPSTSTGPDR